MQPPAVSEAEIAQIKQDILAGIAGVSTELVAAANALLEQVATPNWVLEWGLPRWLGESLGTPAGITRQLVLANVYGLAFARLTDDIADGEYAAADATRDDAGVLAAALHHLWMVQYTRVFAPYGPQADRFWVYFDEYIVHWLRATSGRHLPAASCFRAYTDADFLRLAARGSPLKICCAAACLIALREDDIAILAAAIDKLMTGVVLLDDAFDWLEDLEAGRYNAFVAYCSDMPQTRDRMEANRRAILREIHFGSAARPYFGVTAEHLRQAEQAAGAAGCPGLQHFIAWFRTEAAACGTSLAEQARTRVCAAAEGLDLSDNG